MNTINRSLIMGGVFVSALTLLSCGNKQEKKEEAPLVDFCEVVDANGESIQRFTGKTKTASEVKLAFRVSGQLQNVLVKEGDYVRKGQVVAVMDSRDYQVQLNATQAEYDQIKADAERVMSLYSEGNTTASNNDKARYGLQQITQKLQNHKNQLADTQLRSTIDGYVQSKIHEAGETVSAGLPVVSIFDKGNTEVEIKMSATDFANMENYTRFYCKFDVTGDQEFPVAVSRTSQEANSSQLYAVRLKFVNGAPEKITPGMTTMVYAVVNGGKGSGVVKVPNTAVFNKGDKACVYVIDEKTNVVSIRNVNVTTLHTDGTCEIDNGLSVGETIVCTGVHHVTDKQKVRKLSKPSKDNVGGLL